MIISTSGLRYSGAWRPVEVLAPEGTVVNATYPAPVVYANHEISHRVCDMVFAALASFIPDRVMACSQGTSAVLTLGGVDYRTGERYVSYETVKGGFGARPDRDGINAIASGISNTMNTPVEIIEMSFPVRVETYELRPDSGGAGRFRGGLGARRTWRVLERDTRATVCCERTKSAPFGIAGGAAGAPARISVIEPGGTERVLNSKGSFDAQAGSLVVFDVPGSGGYGPPAERDPARLREDLRDGYVTPEGAKRDYGRRAAVARASPRLTVAVCRVSTGGVPLPPANNFASNSNAVIAGDSQNGYSPCKPHPSILDRVQRDAFRLGTVVIRRRVGVHRRHAGVFRGLLGVRRRDGGAESIDDYGVVVVGFDVGAGTDISRSR